MATIVPLSDLAYNTDHILEVCHSKNEPVFLTKDGYGKLVVLSIDQYNDLKTRAEAYDARAKIDSALNIDNPDDGIKKIPIDDVVDILKEELKKQQQESKLYSKK